MWLAGCSPALQEASPGLKKDRRRGKIAVKADKDIEIEEGSRGRNIREGIGYFIQRHMLK